MILKNFSVRNMANNNTPNNNNTQFRVKKYFPPPPIIGSYFEYIDLNKDEKVRERTTEFFHKKVIKWASTYKEFNHLKPKLKKIESEEGKKVVYNLIRYFVKVYNINWWHLKDHYVIFKDFLRAKLGQFI